MELHVLAVGDVVGDGGLQCLEKHLRSLKNSTARTSAWSTAKTPAGPA
ncbi:MAG: hypothetical protein ACLUFI_11155 [Oscillospiraceae bacterium]